ERLAIPLDQAGAYGMVAGNGAQKRRLADAVAAHERCYFALAHFEVHSAQHLCGPVMQVDVLDLQHGALSHRSAPQSTSKIDLDDAGILRNRIDGPFGNY